VDFWIYNVQGVLLQKFEKVKSGKVLWHGGNKLPSGAYFLKAKAGKLQFIKKIILKK